MWIRGGQIVPQLKNVFPQFLCSRELLVKFTRLQRKNVTQLMKKGTLCPPEEKLHKSVPLSPYFQLCGNKNTNKPMQKN